MANYIAVNQAAALEGQYGLEIHVDDNLGVHTHYARVSLTQTTDQIEVSLLVNAAGLILAGVPDGYTSIGPRFMTISDVQGLALWANVYVSNVGLGGWRVDALSLQGGVFDVPLSPDFVTATLRILLHDTNTDGLYDTLTLITPWYTSPATAIRPIIAPFDLNIGLTGVGSMGDARFLTGSLYVDSINITDIGSPYAYTVAAGDFALVGSAATLTTDDAGLADVSLVSEAALTDQAIATPGTITAYRAGLWLATWATPGPMPDGLIFDRLVVDDDPSTQTQLSLNRSPVDDTGQ